MLLKDTTEACRVLKTVRLLVLIVIPRGKGHPTPIFSKTHLTRRSIGKIPRTTEIFTQSNTSEISSGSLQKNLIPITVPVLRKGMFQDPLRIKDFLVIQQLQHQVQDYENQTKIEPTAYLGSI